ncbi:hypothetical protein K439DRAFT_1624800 [Ramaria rubella]|nr:hypothetical protein K439DRAFT_1624800 [Ramaria rubella]
MQALDIQPDEFLASWDNASSTWEWHTSTTPHVVFAGQQLLYKYTTPDKLPDDMCNGLEEELAQQCGGAPEKCKRGAEVLSIPMTPWTPLTAASSQALSPAISPLPDQTCV